MTGLLSAFLLLSTPFPSSPAAQFSPLAVPPDFEARTLEVLRGNDDEADVSAACRLWSDGQRLHLEVAVRDDVPVLRDDPFDSDHVEIWLDPLGLDTRYFLAEGLSEHLLAYRPGPEGRPESDDRAARAMQDELAGLVEAGEDVTVRPVRDWAGIVHLGLYPGSRQAYGFDRRTGRRLLPQKELAEHVSVRSELTRNGYRVRAAFSIDALGIVTAPAVTDVQFQVDVIDVDRDGQKPETVLSTSADRGPDTPFRLQPLELSQPLTVDVVGLPNEALEALDLSPTMWLTDRGWQAVAIKREPLVVGYRKSSTLADTIAAWPFELRHRRRVFTGRIIDRMSWYEASTQAVDARMTRYSVDGALWTTSRLPAVEQPDREPSRLDARDGVFVFPDGALGLMAHSSRLGHPHGWGTCGAAEFWELDVVRFDADGPRSILTVVESACHAPRIGEIQLGEDELQSIESVEWKEPGEHLVVTVTGSEYHVTWDASHEPVIRRVELPSAEAGAP